MSDSIDHNPFLARVRGGADTRRGLAAGDASPAPSVISIAPQRGAIDPPNRAVGGGAENLAWQTRDHAPTEYENRLGDALEAAFEAGADSAAAMAGHLNAQGVLSPSGERWDAASFEAAMRELGA